MIRMNLPGTSMILSTHVFSQTVSMLADGDPMCKTSTTDSEVAARQAGSRCSKLNSISSLGAEDLWSIFQDGGTSTVRHWRGRIKILELGQSYPDIWATLGSSILP